MVERCIEKLISHKSLVTNLFLQWVQWASKKLICKRKTICFLCIYFNLYKYSFLKCNWTWSNRHKVWKKWEKDHGLKDASVWWICSKMKTKVFLDFYCLQYTGIWNSRVKKPCWTANLRIMTSQNRVTSNCDVIVNFL